MVTAWGLALLLATDNAGYLDYDIAPPMPATVEASGLPPWRAVDAVWMALPDDASDVERRLLLVSDLPNLEDALLTGNLRGGTVLALELLTGARAEGDSVTELFNFNRGVIPADNVRAGHGALLVFEHTSCSLTDTPMVLSGYVTLSPSRDSQRQIAHIHVGFGAGQTLQARVATRPIQWLAHMRGAASVRCSPAFGGV